MEPYAYEDGDGNTLYIGPHPDKISTAIIQAETVRRPVCVPAKDFRGVVDELARACGLLVPVIINRSSASFPEDGGPFRFGEFGFRLDGEGLVLPSLPGVTAMPVPPAALRELAGHLVALAEQAEAEPDPEEVDGLAAAVRAEFQSDGTPPTEWEKKVARAALRWMNAKGARDAQA
jgi:hypothetical protein